MGFLPPVVATLLADTKQFQADMMKADATMAKFGATADASGSKFGSFANKASTAIIGVGVALGAYAIDKAFKFEEALNAIQNQTGASAHEMSLLRTEIMSVSNATATSSGEIASAFLQAEKAGLRGTKAYQLVNDAAKAAVITGSDVTTMTTTLIAAQTLGVTKGMSLAKVTDLIVEANKRHIGSVSTLVQVLSGRLGAALAATGLKLGQLAAIADISSKAGYTQSRTMVSLATGLTKIENPTTASTKALLKLNISASALASEARKPGGLITVLEDLRQQSQRTGVSFNTLVTAAFGSSAVGLVDILNNHLGELAKTTKILNTASATKLDVSFGLAAGQTAFKMKQLKTEFTNALTGVGLLLLPTVTDLANWSANAVKYFRSHPLVEKIATDSAIGLFATAVAYKIGKGLVSAVGAVKSIFTGSALTLNTTATQLNTDALLGRTGAGLKPPVVVPPGENGPGLAGQFAQSVKNFFHAPGNQIGGAVFMIPDKATLNTWNSQINAIWLRDHPVTSGFSTNVPKFPGGGASHLGSGVNTSGQVSVTGATINLFGNINTRTGPTTSSLGPKLPKTQPKKSVKVTTIHRLVR
jgi:TP901 family phage tail tape measure protein